MDKTIAITINIIISRNITCQREVLFLFSPEQELFSCARFGYSAFGRGSEAEQYRRSKGFGRAMERTIKI
jgi:hypothetical protein